VLIAIFTLETNNRIDYFLKSGGAQAGEIENRTTYIKKCGPSIAQRSEQQATWHTAIETERIMQVAHMRTIVMFSYYLDISDSKIFVHIYSWFYYNVTVVGSANNTLT